MAQKFQNALVIGASRGLGYGLVHELAGRGVTVTGTVRNTKHIEALRSDAPGHLTWQLLDITDEQSIHSFVHNLAHPRYDLVYFNAGIWGPKDSTPEHATDDEISELFITNAVAPIRLARQLRTHLNQESSTVVFMTSILGSVQLNTSGGQELYRASKAALNSLTRSYAASVAETGITVLSIHPGWVATDMGGSQAPLDVRTSVNGIVNVLTEHAGTGGHQYLDYRGKTLPW